MPNDNQGQSLLRYDGEFMDMTKVLNVDKAQINSLAQHGVEEENIPPHLTKNILVTDLDEESDGDQIVLSKENKNNSDKVDVNSWNIALDTALEQKTADVNTYCVSASPVRKNEATNDEAITPSPQSRAEYSAEDVEDEFSNAEDLPGWLKLLNEIIY